MDVIVGGGGHVKIDDMRNALHVQAARGDVGGYHDLVLAALEPAQGALTLPLSAVAVQAGGFEAGPFDLLRQPVGTVFGAGKDQDRFGVGLFEQVE